MSARSSTGQSIGLRIRGLGVQIPPGAPMSQGGFSVFLSNPYLPCTHHVRRQTRRGNYYWLLAYGLSVAGDSHGLANGCAYRIKTLIY
jgi:hypothetical protein